MLPIAVTKTNIIHPPHNDGKSSVVTLANSVPITILYHKYMKGGRAYLSFSSYTSNLALSEVGNMGVLILEK